MTGRVSVCAGGATVYNSDGQPVADVRVRYTPHGELRPIDAVILRGADTWYPWPRHWGPEPDGRYLTIDDVALLANMPANAVEAGIDQMMLLARQSAAAEMARIERGRQDWRALSEDERDALDVYAIACEGHTLSGRPAHA